MRLVSISVVNFKGQTFTKDIESITQVIGENWIGKTTLTDAIRILLVGYLPEIGKKASENFEKLASGREMVVSGKFDSGERIARKWFISGDSVKSASIVPPSLEQFEGMSVMLNADEYFKKSDRERVDYVTANIPMSADKWSPIVVQEKIRVALETPEAEANYTAADIETFLARLDEICTEKGFKTPQEFVAVAIESTNDMAKAIRDHSERMQRTIQGLTYLRTQDQTGGASIASIEDQMGLLARELTELTEKKGVFIGSYDAIVKARERLKYLRKEIEAGAKDRLSMADWNATRNSASDELAKLSIPGLSALSVMLIENANLLSGAKTIRIQIDAHAKAIASMEKNLQELDAATVCPYCGATGEGWKTIRAAELAISIEDITQKHAELVKIETHALEKHRNAVAAHASAAAVQARGDALSRQIDTADREIHRLTGLISRLDALQSEFDQLPAEDPLLQAQVDEVQTAINMKTDSKRNLAEVHRKAMARAGDLQRLAEAEKQRDDGAREIEATKAAAVALREIQAQMVKDVFVPLLERANELFGGMLVSPIDYKDGEIGTWRGGLWFTHKTFSGAEKALTYAAIQIALSTLSPFGIMILDDMGRISDKNIPHLFYRVDQAIERGDLAQFIGNDVGRKALYSTTFAYLKAERKNEGVTFKLDELG